jgi:phosphohistidine phosphatase
LKRLILLRHAKSSWDDPDLPDQDRPLAPRGRKAATKMGQHIQHIQHIQTQALARPELVLCSPALRARQTLERVLPFLDPQPKVVFDEAIYGASAGELLYRLHRVDRSVGSLMVVGHNPGIEDLAVALVGTIESFPTAALAILVVPVDTWDEVGRPGPGPTARLDHFATPRSLP